MKLQLKDARKKAKASFAALQSELSSGGAASTRYAAWPPGCAVRVSCDGPQGVGCADVGGLESAELVARMVSYDKAAHTFEVQLDDGSTRTVPEQRVTRLRARERALAAEGAYGISQRGAAQAPPAYPPPSGRIDQKERLRTAAAERQPPTQPPEPDTQPWSPTRPTPQKLGRAQLGCEV